MVSLSAILSRYGPILLLDAASAVVHAGWISADDHTAWTSSSAEAGVGVFAALRQLGRSPNEAAAFVFCEGPGSILGIRTVATILRTWTALRPRPVFAYRSLELTARSRPRPDATVICDARRQSWHALSLDATAAPGPLLHVDTLNLPAGPLFTPAGFRRWSALPDRLVEEIPYQPAQLAEALRDAALLRSTQEPDAFLHEDPSYVQWNPQVHQAPEARP